MAKFERLKCLKIYFAVCCRRLNWKDEDGSTNSWGRQRHTTFLYWPECGQLPWSTFKKILLAAGAASDIMCVGKTGASHRCELASIGSYIWSTILIQATHWDLFTKEKVPTAAKNREPSRMIRYDWYKECAILLHAVHVSKDFPHITCLVQNDMTCDLARCIQQSLQAISRLRVHAWCGWRQSLVMNKNQDGAIHTVSWHNSFEKFCGMINELDLAYGQIYLKFPIPNNA